MSRDGLRLSVTLLSILPGALIPAFGKNMEGHVPGQPADSGPAQLGGVEGHGPGQPADPGPPQMGGPCRAAAGEAMLWAPLVGLVLGVIAAAVLYVFGQLLHTGSLVASVVAVGTLAVLTRGLHLDGLADLADGLGSRRPADGALAVMRRSDIGPFGVVTLVLVLLIQVAGLTQADSSGRGVPAVIVAAVTGRLVITWACRRGVPPARPDGLGALVADSVSPVAAVVLTVVVLAVTVAGIFLAAAVAAVPVEWIVPVAVAAGLVAGAGLAEHASRRLGGITGDVLGAVAETATAACLLVTAIS
ncbi:MAG TPA: adenosylcobinamide-GDP ribazoletransferase [Streptosporangiaceae bacterium]